MDTEDKSGLVCSKCGVFLLGDEPLKGHCLACLLDPAFDQEEGPVEAAELFDHYRLATHSDGRPVELGRGGMGITYRAFDINLHCPVTLKVISKKHLDDESVRLRFLREARTAAKLRHSNIAALLHLGRRGRDYFYAMEFVEGETLSNLIKRCGRLEMKLALEIASQVAAGLAALHKKNLVHRDIKPNNIMVGFEDGNLGTVKIIDLGLAKAVEGSQSETTISIAGSFVGTPEFASPEQFAGLGVDIRSDLYSLGITLWTMLKGKTPFEGTPAELMYQHQHAPLPLEQMKGVAQPVSVMLETLLDKDPARRFRSPSDLLNIIPWINEAVDAGQTIPPESFQQILRANQRTVVRRPQIRPGQGPENISIARLPVTGGNCFGREEDIAFLDDAWANQHANVVTIVAWAGVGKSTLVNHWLRHMAIEYYRSADLVFGWSFYRQGTSRGSASADEFIDAALTWFGDPDPKLGTAWEKGERLAKLVAHRRTLLVLDGLEPLQNPLGPEEGRLYELSLQSFLRELAAFSAGLCVITTRMPIGDLSVQEPTSVLRRDLEQLSSDAGGKVLQALGVKGHEIELQAASDELSGHCLALTLLGSYLSEAYNGDIRCRSKVCGHLTHDVRQGSHARKVLESYESWLGDGPELSVLRILGLFDRPADEKILGTLLIAPAIHSLTESLTDLPPAAWHTILARLRRAKLLAAEDSHNPGQLDAHPLVREYFGEQLRSQRTVAWKECNRRLYNYYCAIAPQVPNSFREMEPLFLAVKCGCNAGLFRETLHEVYLPRIERGDVSYAAKTLGARGALLSVLVHFFKHENWELPVEIGVEEQSLSADDQLYILTQTALFLTALRGHASLAAAICYERVECLCASINRPRYLYVALTGQWRHSYMTNNPRAALQIAERVHVMAQEQDDPALLLRAYNLLAGTLYYVGDIGTAHQYVMRSVQIWRSGRVAPEAGSGELESGTVVSIGMAAICEWHLGRISSSQALMDEAISLAKTLNDISALALALQWAANLAYYNHNHVDVERLASALIELSTRQNFLHWLTQGTILRGWALSVSGDTTKGIALIEDGIRNYRATGAMQNMPFLLALKAEALHLGGRSNEALEVIGEAETLIERCGEYSWHAELHRLRGVLLSTVGGEIAQIEASFCEAIGIARKQKSISIEKRAEASYTEYFNQKPNAFGGT
jgi:tetratricopeptide (TPR) repeat protein